MSRGTEFDRPESLRSISSLRRFHPKQISALSEISYEAADVLRLGRPNHSTSLFVRLPCSFRIS